MNDLTYLFMTLCLGLWLFCVHAWKYREHLLDCLLSRLPGVAVLPLQMRSCQTMNTTGKKNPQNNQGLRKRYQHHMVMILYLISCLCFWPTESWTLLFKKCIEKWDYKAVIQQMPELVWCLRGTLHRCRHISMWCLQKATVWGFDHRIYCMLHACWACMESCRLVSMFEDFKKKEKSKLYVNKIFVLSPPSIYVSVMKHTMWRHA